MTSRMEARGRDTLIAIAVILIFVGIGGACGIIRVGW